MGIDHIVHVDDTHQVMDMKSEADIDESGEDAGTTPSVFEDEESKQSKLSK
jgi:hypothetical protein